MNRRKAVSKRVRAAYRALARLRPGYVPKKKAPKGPRVRVYVAGTVGASTTPLVATADARPVADGWNVKSGTESAAFYSLVAGRIVRSATKKGNTVIARGIVYRSAEAAAEAYEQACMTRRNQTGTLAGDADVAAAPEYLAARAAHEAAKVLLAKVRQADRAPLQAKRDALIAEARAAYPEVFKP